MKKTINDHKWVIASIFLAVVLVFLIFSFISDKKTGEKSNYESSNQEIKTLADGTRYLVHPNNIISGGPSKGGIGVDRGIPALAEENINFVSVEEADEWIDDSELVLALTYNGVERVYPLQILVWHEIANDNINGNPILVTYCPLCGSGIAYERKIEFNSERIETRFGTSGKLYNSNLIMYDEKTETYWQQI
ncbi:DUF3179 domain-containing protein, partial [Candidatus Pacearchaeota archaeon]|nr:DUF3179 domain-containing protein [Candidatus Pacearchaeota archaeon]